jgi:TIR domain
MRAMTRDLDGPQIFISYRRGDTAGYAGRLFDRLIQSFSKDNVFMDVDGLPLGTDFTAVLEKKLASCDLALILIGPQWVGARDAEGRRRLDSPDDFVRMEVAAALKRDMPVIPILFDDARMPMRDELPPELRDLPRRNAFKVDHATFHVEVASLIEQIKRFGPRREYASIAPPAPQSAPAVARAGAPDSLQPQTVVAAKGGTLTTRARWASIAAAVMVLGGVILWRSMGAAPQNPQLDPSAVAAADDSVIDAVHQGPAELANEATQGSGTAEDPGSQPPGADPPGLNDPRNVADEGEVSVYKLTGPDPVSAVTQANDNELNNVMTITGEQLGIQIDLPGPTTLTELGAYVDPKEDYGDPYKNTDNVRFVISRDSGRTFRPVGPGAFTRGVGPLVDFAYVSVAGHFADVTNVRYLFHQADDGREGQRIVEVLALVP